MTTRIQGQNLVADLPAEAARIICGGLQSRLMLQARMATGYATEEEREEALDRMEIYNRQSIIIAEKAWHAAPDTVVPVRINERCWREILLILQKAEVMSGTDLVADAIDALQTALFGEGTIELPDGP
jgi:hypothetical protein